MQLSRGPSPFWPRARTTLRYAVIGVVAVLVPGRQAHAQVVQPRGETGPTGVVLGQVWLGGDITARRAAGALVVAADDQLERVYGVGRTDQVGGYVLTQLPRNEPIRIVAFYSDPLLTGATERRIRISGTAESHRANLLFNFRLSQVGESDPDARYGASPLGLVEYALHLLNVIIGGQVGTDQVAPRYLGILEQVARRRATSSPPNPSQAPREPFRVSPRPMRVGSANDETCRSLFGREYAMADWDDIAPALRQGISPDQILPEGHAWVTRSGSHFWTPSRPYFMSRLPVHAGYSVMDRLDPFVLGSWDGSYQLLCSRL